MFARLCRTQISSLGGLRIEERGTILIMREVIAAHCVQGVLSARKLDHAAIDALRRLAGRSYCRTQERLTSERANPRMVGFSDAMLMMLTGVRIDAEHALRIGLVSRVVSPEALAPAAREIALRITANAPLAVRAVKRLVRDGLELPLLAGIQAEQFALGLLRDTEHRIEGRRAFQEKRSPTYRGR
jgi:hypothetical protein